MRERKIGSVGATSLRTLVLSGLLLSQGRFAEAQQAPSNAGDAPVVPRSSAIQGRDANPIANAAGNVGGDQDLRLLIAHGLEMAIEGSALQGLAMQPGLPSGAMGDSPSGATTRGTAGTSGTNSSGLGFTGLPGETVSGRPVTTPATGTGSSTVGASGTGPTSLGNSVAAKGMARAGQPSSEAAASAPPMAGSSPASMLRQQAARSFQASNDLLGQANPAAGPDQNFSEAARIYAATLKSLGSQPASPTGAGRTGTAVPEVAGLPESRPVGAPAASTIGATELASIALINHGVKDALGAMKIKQMARSMGSSTSPAAQQLLAHARQMDDGSRSTIRSIVGGAAGTVGPGGVVEALAQQANQLVQAIQALNPEPAAPGR